MEGLIIKAPQETQVTMRFFLLAFLVFSFSIEIHASAEQVDSNEVIPEASDTIVITGKRIDNFSKHFNENEVSKTESISQDLLKRYGSQSLADAIQQARGIDTQLLCANCGAKRISINGLKGEHTTILIDGFPLHSTVSSFYGMDAVPVVGIDRIEINRGAGSSLVSPESIGGSINLISLEPVTNGGYISYELGNMGSSQSSIIGSVISDKSSLQIVGYQGITPSWDVDQNNVAESPQRSSQSVSLSAATYLDEDTQIKLRYSQGNLEIIGGNTVGYRPSNYSPEQADPEDFINKDVREKYTGALDPITEWIRLKRQELALSYNTYFDDDSQLLIRTSTTNQMQNSIYSHAFDYNNRDRIHYGSISYKQLFDHNHLLSLGFETKKQQMSSNSIALYEKRVPPLIKDNFEFTSNSIFLMDEIQASSNLALNLALRLDKISVRWKELNREIDELILAPRFLGLWQQTEHLSSRLALGLGYRPPLTLFESQHGSSHDGFELDIKNVETALSGVYTLSLNYPTWFTTWSVHTTRLKHMAYAIDRIRYKLPLKYVNSDEIYTINVIDWYLGGKTDYDQEWQLGIERYYYPNSYAKKLPTASIEFRIQADFSQKSLIGVSSIQAVHVGARDLSRFNYDKHFNVYNTDVTSVDFGKVSSPKRTKAPAYTLINLIHEIPIENNYKVKFRVNNLTNFTQASLGDTPATWHWHETHAHFDNFHTWGPNQGREYFVELSASF